MGHQMVTVSGVRYRVEDAVRLGLVGSPSVRSTPAEVKERPAPSNKARTAPQNKGGKGAGSTTKRNGAASPTSD